MKTIKIPALNKPHKHASSMKQYMKADMIIVNISEKSRATLDGRNG